MTSDRTWLSFCATFKTNSLNTRKRKLTKELTDAKVDGHMCYSRKENKKEIGQTSWIEQPRKESPY